MAVTSTGSTQGRDISRIPRLATPLVDIAVALPSPGWRGQPRTRVAALQRQILDRAHECNVKCILPGYQIDEAIYCRESCGRFVNDGLMFTAGVHPNAVPGSVKKNGAGQLVISKDNETRQLEQVLQEVRNLAAVRECVAIGETGLDYKRNSQTWKTQKKWCADQIRLACELKMPLFMHEREAFDDLDDLLRGIQREFGELPPIVIHCFTGKRWQAEAYIKAGFYIGVTGFLLMADRGRDLRGFIREAIPLDKLLLETDSPFMGFGNDDHRCSDFQRENEPCTLPVLAVKVAELYGVDAERIARQTTLNAQRFYGRDFGIREEVLAAPRNVDQASSSSAVAAQGRTGSPAAPSVLSNNEKDVLRLAKKFREIAKLEEKMASGAILPANQQEKVAKKGDLAVELRVAMELLLSTSVVLEMIPDVTSALGRVSNATGRNQLAADNALADAPLALANAPHNNAPLAVGSAPHCQDDSQPVTETPAEPAPALGASAPGEKRWRPRGGRSGFARAYAKDHL